MLPTAPSLPQWTRGLSVSPRVVAYAVAAVATAAAVFYMMRRAPGGAAASLPFDAVAAAARDVFTGYGCTVAAAVGEGEVTCPFEFGGLGKTFSLANGSVFLLTHDVSVEQGHAAGDDGDAAQGRRLQQQQQQQQPHQQKTTATAAAAAADMNNVLEPFTGTPVALGGKPGDPGLMQMSDILSATAP